MRTTLAAACLLGLTACSTVAPPSVVVPQRTLAWRSIATEADRIRLRDWRTAFNEGLRAARASGSAAEIAKEGYETGKSLYDIVVKERKLLTQQKWDEVFSFENLISPKFEQ